jgi:chromosome segregation ATPase
MANLDETTGSNNEDLVQQFEEAQRTAAELKKRLEDKTTENEQLQEDIRTLIDFKNELESLVEDQNTKIQQLNNVSVIPFPND